MEAGTQLEIRFEDGRIEIEPAPLEVHLVKKRSLTVAMPAKAAGSLTAEQVEQTRQRLREERGARR